MYYIADLMKYGTEKLPADFLVGIAQRARSLRKKLGLTQEALASKAGISVRSVIRFEQNGNVTLESLLRIAFALDSTQEFETLFQDRKPVEELNKLFE